MLVSSKQLLFQNPLQIVDAVNEVLDSGDEHGMGVIIQRFIESDYSEVVFSCNPLTGVAKPVIEICRGRGEQLVSEK
ncbi:PEP/pyruvate-binding domain-containing protein [Anoxybacter fermentans]|uniref:PEP/pyruvate-binding domain-containing protein n=1 Tax=Anoxybacter fermentans TaxID=1323375 RepID=UPI0013DEFA78|nr:PEP/pyruvate-binding domain-containing protein [Anoxybacter fermentans]